MHFTALERAVWDEIGKQADEREVLERQLATARVTRRKNTGEGFFTYFAVDRNGAPLASRSRVLGNVAATIEDFERPLLLALFMNKDGYADMLEATAAGESTVGVDLATVGFTINPIYSGCKPPNQYPPSLVDRQQFSGAHPLCRLPSGAAMDDLSKGKLPPGVFITSGSPE